MKKLIVKMAKFNAPSRNCPTCGAKYQEGQEVDSSYMARIKEALAQPPQGGFSRLEDAARDAIEDKLMAAAKANKGKLPFDLFLEETDAKNLKRIVVDEFRPQRRGNDLRQLFDDIRNMKTFEMVKGKLVEKKDK